MQDLKKGQKASRSITITAEAEVLSVHASKPVTQLGITIKRQDGETVLEGEAWCYTFSPDS